MSPAGDNGAAGAPGPEEERERMLDSWDRAAAGWTRQADSLRDHGMPVSAWLIEHLRPQPGQRVLELAAGPGDTGFIAAEAIAPGGGVLVSSDASEAMLQIARSRAADQGIANVEFKQLQLEWIDLETASVDGLVCRWGLMLCVDPDAALKECRRVLRPGGRAVLAVWDVPAANPWATIPQGALVALGHLAAPEPGGAGMFALAAPGELARRMSDAGFIEPVVEPVQISRSYELIDDWLDGTRDCSIVFANAWRGLSGEQRAELIAEIERRAEPYTAADGSVTLPGSSLAVVAEA
jgi:SAM-dependent methyltransferase